jgi:hypothetical protein
MDAARGVEGNHLQQQERGMITTAPTATAHVREILDHTSRAQKLRVKLSRARSQATRETLLDLLNDRLETIELEAKDLLSKAAN